MGTESRDTGFDRIFSEHHKSVYNYILRMVKERSVAEELVQDVFLKVHGALADFRGDSGISTWIYKIATNACYDYFRSKRHNTAQRTAPLHPGEILEKETPEEICLPTTAEEEVISAEMSSCVQLYIDDLSEDYRAVILLHDSQGFTNAEIADITGTTLENVKIRLHRARQKMKEVFSSKCRFYRDERNVFRCIQKEEDESGDSK